MDKLIGRLAATGGLGGALAGQGSVAGALATLAPAEDYQGETTITPSQEEQVLHTAGMRVREDIVIAAIPENYGLVTWSGSVITVS